MSQSLKYGSLVCDGGGIIMCVCGGGRGGGAKEKKGGGRRVKPANYSHFKLSTVFLRTTYLEQTRAVVQVLLFKSWYLFLEVTPDLVSSRVLTIHGFVELSKLSCMKLPRLNSSIF